MTRSPKHALPIVAVTLALLVGCGDGEPAPTADPGTDGTSKVTIDDRFEDLTGQEAVVIQTRDNSFDDQYVVVSPGTEVTFDNRGRNPHNAIPATDGAFAEIPTDALQPGDEVARTLEEPGEYAYYCSLHGTKTAGMTGTIVVDG